MKSIVFFNNKGGVGKTTLICNLGAYLSLKKGKKVLIIDADPQCNATQLMLNDEAVNELYDKKSSFTIYSVIHPLSIGKGYSELLETMPVESFGVDLLPGDPRLALKEDLLSTDWQAATAGDVRGLRTSFLFSELLDECEEYDYVLFDVGPSLGSINRAVLLSADYFLSPMSIDIFSIRAVENIAIALTEWQKRLQNGLSLVADDAVDDLPENANFDIKFVGYVAQQYIQKTKEGKKRAVDSYERIMKRIPQVIRENFVERLTQPNSDIEYQIGTVANLYSLIPMSQTARKPVFALKAKDGVRGSHFSRVADAETLYEAVSEKLFVNISKLG